LINEEHHLALPKLYGAPAYARPPRPVEVTERPLDEDDLPLEAFRGFDDPGGPPAGGDAAPVNGGSNGSGSPASGSPVDGEARLEARPFSLRSLSRFLSGR
jgi:hypothetical protein